MSNNEELLNALLNDEDVSNFECRSRNEHFLKKCCLGEECDMEPTTRMEYLLKQLSCKIAEGSGKPEQEKSVTITENGTTEVVPDDGMSLSKVTITTKIQAVDDMLQARVDSINSCSQLFEGYKGSNVDFIERLNTSNVTDMSQMFYYCSNLTSIPQLDSSNVTNMHNMFANCSKLTTVPQLDTSKVTSMYNMFFQCSRLTSIPQLDTSKATNINAMFQYCSNLTSIPQLDTSNATNISGLFSNCWNLTTIPKLDTSKATSLSQVFSNCEKLTAIPKLDTSNVTNMNGMCNACTNLLVVDISKFNISTTTNSNVMFSKCHSLKQVIIRSFGSNFILSSGAFYKCYHFDGTVDETYNPNGDKDGYIYVPRDMVDTLKAATNWATYADQIRALEDYTVDGTTTGELDESKI